MYLSTCTDMERNGIRARIADDKQSSFGTQNASGTSEQRSGADLSQGSGDTGGKSGSESLLDSVEKSVHERGEGEHSRAPGSDSA
jgi:hypothetical protein